ncbi:MAG: hypothetical protein U0L54_03840 [Bacteroidales bacterium]|nr:hypothetical protein [Bacteroidales bacterium]
MKRIFLFTTLAMLLFISCGGGPTEIVTETATETAIEDLEDSISPATEYESVNNSSNEIEESYEEVSNTTYSWLNGQWAFGYRWEDIYGNIFMDWCVLWIELETNNIEVHYYPGRTAGHKSKYVYNGTFTIDEDSNNIKFIIDEPFKSVNSWENEIMGYKRERIQGTLPIIWEKSMNFKFDPDRRVIYNYIQGGNRPFEKCGPGWRIGG